MSLRRYLKSQIVKEILFYFKDENNIDKKMMDSIIDRWSDDKLNSERTRFIVLSKYINDCKSKKLLDMASGCGSFVIQGLVNGWDLFGVEPEQWKLDLIDLKFEENKYPSEWRARIKKGVGEDLPFEDESFDAFNSWQTFEHVENIVKCLEELHRVLCKNGTGVVHCPSYMTFYEGHYRIFWLPMMGNSRLARIYLKIMGRPVEGLKTFNPISQRQLVKKAKEVGFNVKCITRMDVYEAGRSRFPFLQSRLGKIGLPILFQLWKIKEGVKRFGRNEKSIHLLLTKEN